MVFVRTYTCKIYSQLKKIQYIKIQYDVFFYEIVFLANIKYDVDLHVQTDDGSRGFKEGSIISFQRMFVQRIAEGMKTGWRYRRDLEKHRDFSRHVCKERFIVRFYERIRARSFNSRYKS